jgi:putative colanic acid biosynthesis glycosyltransferase
MSGADASGEQAAVLSANPFFSVISVCYNNLSGLKETEASLFAQDCADYQWLVVDGASGDGTQAHLAAIADPRLVATSEKDKGIYDAMEKGLIRATGDYLIFMNAGDTFADAGVLGAVKKLCTGRMPDLIYGDAYECDGAQRFYKPSRDPSAVSYVMFTHHQSIFYRRTLAQRVGFDHSYRMSCDWVMTGRILAVAGPNTLKFDGPISAFARGGVSQSKNMRAVFNRELFRIYRDEHLHPLLRAALLWSRKVLVNKVREKLPGLYDRIRYGRPSVSAKS